MGLLQSISGQSSDSYSKADSLGSHIAMRESEMNYRNTIEGLDEQLNGLAIAMREANRLEVTQAAALNTLEETSDYKAVMMMAQAEVSDVADFVNLSLASTTCTIESVDDFVTYKEAKDQINTIEGIGDDIWGAIKEGSRIAIQALLKVWVQLRTLFGGKKAYIQKLQEKAREMEGKYEAKNSQFTNESVGKAWSVGGKYEASGPVDVIKNTKSSVDSLRNIHKETEELSKTIVAGDATTRSVRKIADAVDDLFTGYEGTVKVENGIRIHTYKGFVGDRSVNLSYSNDTSVALKVALKVSKAENDKIDSSIPVMSLKEIIGVCGELVSLTAAIEDSGSVSKNISAFEKVINAAYDTVAAKGKAASKTMKANSNDLSKLSQFYSQCFKAVPSLAAETATAGITLVAAQLGQYKKS